MFALNMHGVAYVTNYNEAVAMYAKAEPLKGCVGERGIPGKAGTKSTGISMDGDDVVFCYHSTDVVRWRKDNTCLIDLRHESRSTANFADRFCPDDVSVMRHGSVLRIGPWEGGKYYATDGRVVVTAGEVLSGTRPIPVRVVDREAAKQALTYENFHAFVAWYTPLAQFWELKEPEHHWSRRRTYKSNLHRGDHLSVSAIMRKLHDPNEWEAIANAPTFGYAAGPKAFLASLRAAIYEQYGCYRTEYRDFAPSCAAISKWLREAS